jgi:hypothetical protein
MTDNRLYHIGFGRDDLGSPPPVMALLSGDPDRARLIAENYLRFGPPPVRKSRAEQLSGQIAEWATGFVRHHRHGCALAQHCRQRAGSSWHPANDSRGHLRIYTSWGAGGECSH